ncbi:MAG: glycine cleavage system aminomethyltransferase GcvT [Pseudohongiellaceae bacterium]
MGKQTPLYQQHIDAGARMVDFAGWDMPIHYGSVINEHHRVRQQCGMFDVSHMTIVDITGTGARGYLRRLLANDVARLESGQALYSAMLNESGGVIDDLIVYRLANGYRLVVNCATRDKDLAWMERWRAGFDVTLAERDELAIIAVHGPDSIDQVCAHLPEGVAQATRELKNFRATEQEDWLVARTGYTGEKGLELILPASDATALWQALLNADVQPVGLGARDTLRLEAGMNLYGQDMDEEISPLSANLRRTLIMEPADRDFLGREAVEHDLERFEAGELPVQTGLVLEERGVMRAGQKVICYDSADEQCGEGILTSGTFSPTLKHSIALARIPANTSRCEVELRGRPQAVRMVPPGFVRFGKKRFD